MKKLILKQKGFAMAELLAVCTVILLLFSILFSNFLPLLAEFENRLSYNSVTAEYAAHYIRRAYKDSITTKELQQSLDNTLNSNHGVFTVYKDEVLNEMYLKDETVKKEVKKVIEEYGVEEIVISNYKTETLKTKYGNGKLSGYIDYLPRYTKSIYTGESADNIQLYRITLKTKDYGYATTPILTDYYTPGSCWKGEAVSGGVRVTEYLYKEGQCEGAIIISNKAVSIYKNDGSTGTVKGKIVEIGNGTNPVFSGSSINEMAGVVYSNSVTRVNDKAFYGAKNLKYFAGDGSESVFEKIPDSSLMYVGANAFYNTGIEEVEVAPSVQYGNYAFSSMAKLKSVSFDDGVLYVNNNIAASDKKEALTTGLFTKSGDITSGMQISTNNLAEVASQTFREAYVKKIDLGNNLKVVGSQAFYNNKRSNYDIELNIPENLELIGNLSFSKAKIKSIDLNSATSLKEVGEQAFQNNNHLGSITIPKSVTSLGNSSFQNAGVTELYFESGSNLETVEGKVFAGNYIGNKADDPVVLPSGISKISNEMFNGCRSNFSIVIPDSVTTIGSGAFSNAGITKITIPGNVESIGEQAFLGCGSLNNVSFADGHANLKIQSLAFYGCGSLNNIVIPARVSSIGSDAFKNCLALGTASDSIKNYSNIDNWCDIFSIEDDGGKFVCKSVNNNNITRLEYNDSGTQTVATGYTKYINNMAS